MRLPLTALTLLLATVAAPVTEAHAAWQWPVTGDVITSYRNGTDPYASGQHRGIDIAAPAGAAVRAAAAGEVRFAGTAGSSGLTVSVRTTDGYDTSYLHLASLSVAAGSRVAAGHRLGAVGTTGTRSAAAPHLHFGVRTAGSRHTYHDPLRFLPPPAAAGPPAAPPTPAAEPAPAPPVAAPAPIPGAEPQRRTAPGTRPAPRGRRAPRPAPLGRRAPRAAPVGRRGPLPALTGRRAPLPRHAPLPTPTARHGALRAPSAKPAPRPAPLSLSARRPDPIVSRVPRSAPARGEHGTSSAGPDIGWALACAGLLLAAGLLGLSEGGRRSTGRARGVLARLTPSKHPG